MSTITKTIAALQGDFSTYLTRRRDRNLLLRQTDRTLADIHVSRELLDLGVKAWPWTVAADDSSGKPFRLSPANLSTAVQELEAYSDVELVDLGITRGGIVESVLFGRPGIERQDPNAEPQVAGFKQAA